MPFTYNGRSEILILGGDDVTGHHPETGEELWRWGTWNPTRITHWRLMYLHPLPEMVSHTGMRPQERSHLRGSPRWYREFE